MPASVLVGVSAALILLIAGIALVWLGSASKRGRLAPNNTVGIRTRGTLASDGAWRSGHIAAGGRIIVGGLGVVVGAVLAGLGGVLPLLGASEDVTNSVIAVLILAACAWALTWLFLAARAANRAAKAEEDPARP